MLNSVSFFSSKCSLFHNANFFGSCIIHILYTGRAEIKKNNSGVKGLISDRKATEDPQFNSSHFPIQLVPCQYSAFFTYFLIPQMDKITCACDAPCSNVAVIPTMLTCSKGLSAVTAINIRNNTSNCHYRFLPHPYLIQYHNHPSIRSSIM